MPNPGLFTASVSCPDPGGGYTIDGPAATRLDGRIHVSATIAQMPRFLGELPSFHPSEPITTLKPDETVVFDIQSVDGSGQAGESYQIRVVTPEAPCQRVPSGCDEGRSSSVGAGSQPYSLASRVSPWRMLEFEENMTPCCEPPM